MNKKIFVINKINNINPLTYNLRYLNDEDIGINESSIDEWSEVLMNMSYSQ